MATPDCGSTTGRRIFRLDESIPMRVAAAPNAASVDVDIVASGGRRLVFSCPAAGGWAHFAIRHGALSPGEWKISVRAGNSKTRPAPTDGERAIVITVVPAIERTPFVIAVFQANLDFTKPPWHRLEMPIEDRIARLRDDYGVNVLLWWYLNGWVPPEHPRLPEPREPRVLPETIDRITKTHARFMQLNAVARMHQPGGTENDWSDEATLLACRYTTKLAAQRGRPFGGFFGVHLADEPGLSWGALYADGRCEPYRGDPGGRGQKDAVYTGPLAVPAQRRIYEQLTGRPAPDPLHPEKDIDAWLDFMRWRTTILGDVFATLVGDIKSVDARLLGTSQLYAWEALIDGICIRTETRGADIVCNHAYPDRHLGLWYPAHETDTIRTGCWDKPMWHIPVWPGCAPAEGIRAAVYSSLARKLEGLIWSLDSMMTWPQAKEVCQRILPISAMLAACEKPRDPVGIFYSREEFLHAIASDRKDVSASGKDYAGRLNSAWLTAVAAHYPTTQVIEEDLESGAAAKHRVIIAPHLTHCPPAAIAGLRRYVEQGGVLLLDASCTADVPGARRLPFAFPDVFEARGMSDRAMFDSFIRPNVAPLADALRPFVPPAAECDNPMFLLSVQNADSGRYLWAVNMAQDDRPDSKASRWNPVPASGTVELPAGWGAIYDVFARQRVNPGPVKLDLAAGDAAIFALMPSRIDSVIIERLAYDAPNLVLQASVRAADMCVDAVIPLSIDITAPDGTRQTIHRATRHGRFAERLTVGCTPIEGEWQVTVTELLSGAAAEASVLVASPDGVLVDSPRAEVIDAQQIARSLRPENGEILVFGGTRFASQAERLAAELRASGRSARAADAADCIAKTIPLDTKIWPLEQPPLDVRKQVVILGGRDDNPLTRLLVDAYFLYPRQIDEASPGPGRALVWWAAGVFGLDSDIVAIYAEDAAGLDAGAGAVSAIANLATPQ